MSHEVPSFSLCVMFFLSDCCEMALVFPLFLQNEIYKRHMKTHYPLLRPFVLYVIGLAISYACPSLFSGARRNLCMALLLLFFTWIPLCHRFWRYRYRHWLGLGLLPFFFWAGVVQVVCWRNNMERATAPALSDVPAYYWADVLDTEVGEKRVKVKVRLEGFRQEGLPEGELFPMREKCMLRLARSERAERLRYGDVLLLHASLQRLPPPKHPEEFDYRNYLARQNLFLQAYLDDNQWVLWDSAKGNALLRTSARWHQKIIDILRNSDLKQDSKGIAATMLIGDEVMLDDSRSQTFRAAGVSHVLCVSGMHVGIIYLIVDYLLFFLKGGAWRKVLKSGLLLLVIWWYACMLAFSPSVVRSAVMFSFIAVGGLFRRQVRTYSSLLSAAFCMLLFRPLLLFEVGFQLSFLAVWGILWVQPMLQRLWSPHFPPLAFLWSVWSVSIAAQLFTSPVALGCFHQFPVYFLISNVIVMVLAPLVIGVSLFFIMVSSVPFLSALVSKVLNLLVWLMNGGVEWVSRLPHAVWDGFFLTPFQIIVLYVLIFSFLFFLEKRNLPSLLPVLSALLLWIIVHNIIYVQRMRTRELCLYAISGNFAAQLFSATQTTLFVDDTVAYRQGKFDFQLRNLQLRRKAWLPEMARCGGESAGWAWDGNYLQCGGVDFYYLKEYLLADTVSGSMPVWSPDYLLVGKGTHTSLAKALERLHPRHVCILCGVSSKKAALWREDCARAGVPCLWMEEIGMLTFRVSGTKGGRLSIEADPFLKMRCV